MARARTSPRPATIPGWELLRRALDRIMHPVEPPSPFSRPESLTSRAAGSAPPTAGGWVEPEFRYERKFTVRSHPSEVIAVIRNHPAHFREVFAARSIQNIYLDSIDRRAFHDNVIGLAERQKTRLRWYGERFGTPERLTLEIKKRASHLGTKESHPLIPFPIEPGLTIDTLRACFAASDLPEALRQHLATQEPALLNQYRRRYFVSRDGKYRVTVDTDLRFWRLDPLGSRLAACATDRDAIVVELKYGRDRDDDADRVAQWFPFRVSRNSKYVAGVMATSSGVQV